MKCTVCIDSETDECQVIFAGVADFVPSVLFVPEWLWLFCNKIDNPGINPRKRNDVGVVGIIRSQLAEQYNHLWLFVNCRKQGVQLHRFPPWLGVCIRTEKTDIFPDYLALGNASEYYEGKILFFSDIAFADKPV